MTPRGIALVVASMVSLQFGAAIAKTLIADIGAVGTVLLRIGIAAIGLCLVARPSIRGLGRADRLLIVAFGLSLAGMNTAYYAAIERLPLGVAVTIEFVGPLGVAIFGGLRRLDVAWALLAGVGLLLLSPIFSAHLDPVGVLFALLAGGCWAAYILLGSRVGATIPGISGLALALVVAAAVLVIPAVATAGTALLRPEVLGLGAVVAVLSSAIPYVFELEAMRALTPSSFGMLMSLEPAIAASIGAMALGERLGAAELVAIACVLVANVGAVMTL